MSMQEQKKLEHLSNLSKTAYRLVVDLNGILKDLAKSGVEMKASASTKVSQEIGKNPVDAVQFEIKFYLPL